MDLTGQRPKTRAQERFRQWIEPELPFLVRYCRTYYLGPTVDGEDLAQEVVLKAFRAIDGFDGRYPRAWLVTIARNTAITLHRRRSARPSCPLDEHRDPPDSGTWDSSTENAALAGILDDGVREAISELPDHYRSVVELIDLHSRSYGETAEALDIPIGTVMSRVHRGRRLVRRRVARDVGTAGT